MSLRIHPAGSSPFVSGRSSLPEPARVLPAGPQRDRVQFGSRPVRSNEVRKAQQVLKENYNPSRKEQPFTGWQLFRAIREIEARVYPEVKETRDEYKAKKYMRELKEYKQQKADYDKKPVLVQWGLALVGRKPLPPEKVSIIDYHGFPPAQYGPEFARGKNPHEARTLIREELDRKLRRQGESLDVSDLTLNRAMVSLKKAGVIDYQAWWDPKHGNEKKRFTNVKLAPVGKWVDETTKSDGKLS